MGNTLWILKEGEEECDYDYSLILREDQSLDHLANALGVKKLTELFDYSVLAEEFDAPVEYNYIDPQEGIDTFSALVTAINDKHEGIKLNRRKEIIEELEDCLSKCKGAKTQGLKVRLSIIP